VIGNQPLIGGTRFGTFQINHNICVIYTYTHTTLKKKKKKIYPFFPPFLQFLLVFVRIYDFLSLFITSCRFLTLISETHLAVFVLLNVVKLHVVSSVL